MYVIPKKLSPSSVALEILNLMHGQVITNPCWAGSHAGLTTCYSSSPIGQIHLLVSLITISVLFVPHALPPTLLGSRLSWMDPGGLAIQSRYLETCWVRFPRNKFLHFPSFLSVFRDVNKCLKMRFKSAFDCLNFQLARIIKSRVNETRIFFTDSSHQVMIF